MNSETIHTLCLIGLRAMAEYDSVEYRRSTDLSKSDIDQKIEALTDYTNEDEVLRLYSQLTDLMSFSGSPEEMNFKLHQLNSSCFQLAQHFASVYVRTKDLEISPRNYGDSPITLSYHKQQPASEHDELLKLGVMLLLRTLKNYSPQFEYSAPKASIDCLLVPIKEGMPHIVIEAKTFIRNKASLQQVCSQLTKTVKHWGKDTVGIILCGGAPKQIELYECVPKPSGKAKPPRIYLLVFDPRNNAFVGEGYYYFERDVLSKI